MEKGVITFSFDDGRKDTFHIIKNFLEPLDIPAVVYIPTGYIEMQFNDPSDIGYNGLMTKDELDELHKNVLIEIGGHGYMHKNDFNDIKTGIEKLREWYPDLLQFGLASPHSEITRSYVKKHLKEFRSIGFEYIRGGRNFEKFTLAKRGLSYFARITKSPFVFRQCYKGSVNRKKDYYLHAIPIHKQTTLRQVKSMVDYCVKQKCWCILEFHGIDKLGSKEYQEVFCWLEDKFILLCKYVNKLRLEGKLNLATPLQINDSM